MRTVIVDLSVGNLSSVTTAFSRIGCPAEITDDPVLLNDADVIVLPGVGAFAPAARSLQTRGIGAAINRLVRERSVPILGICLGMQLLATGSHEDGWSEGLGLLDGEVVRLRPSPPTALVPNIGWMQVAAGRYDSELAAMVGQRYFYHVHSYHLVCRNAVDVAGTIDFGGEKIVTAVQRGRVFGVQFHPEKSQDDGLDLLHAVMEHFRAAVPARA